MIKKHPAEQVQSDSWTNDCCEVVPFIDSKTYSTTSVTQVTNNDYE